MEAAAVEAAAMDATVDRVVAWKQQHGREWNLECGGDGSAGDGNG